MWKLAKTEWERKLARDRVKQAAIDKKENSKLQFKEYILSRLSLELAVSDFRSESHNHKVRTVIRYSLQYYKQHEIRFRTSALKDEAINFLYHNGYLTEEEIIDKIYLV